MTLCNSPQQPNLNTASPDLIHSYNPTLDSYFLVLSICPSFIVCLTRLSFLSL